MRASIARGVLFAAVIVTAGCSTPAAALRKSRPEVVEKKETAPAKEPSTEKRTSEVAKSDSPFQSSRDRAAASKETAKTDAGEKAATETANIEKPADDVPAKKTDSANVAKSSPQFTRETLQLIDSELRDASPAERARWYDELKQVDATLIPEILRARRLSLQLADVNPPARQALDTTSRDQFASQEMIVQPGPSAAVNTLKPYAVDTHPGQTQSPQRFGDRSSIQPAAHAQSGQNLGAAQQAVYQTPAGTLQPVEQAIYKFDPQRPQQPIVLQNMEYQPPNAPATNGVPPNTAVPSVDPRSLPQTAAMPAPVPWPSPKPAANNPGGFPSSVPFGAGFVQNVVGLMPNRNATPASATTPAPIVPMSSTPSSEWRQELDRTTAYLEQEVAALKPGSSPESQSTFLRKHVALRMLYLMGDHQERALTAIPGLPPAEQEFWQQLFWGVSNALDSDHIPNPKDRATQAISQLNSAIRRLQEQADLQIRNVSFCRQIQYFGNYERFPRDEFRPGQEVLLYAEIDNFKSEPTADGQYRTLLRSTLELLSPSGELRKVIEFPATEDLCRNYRRDYFHNYQFVIPERLPLGPHTLKLTVFDELSGKMSSYSLNLVVK
ncbi:MAG TPA: hypothetical protein VM165_26085 [Planctomycetaceae bacterium]|nr:hypothetical protein [Planctomycetaceae bacterium]